MQNSVIVEIRRQHLHSFTNSLSTPSLLSYWQPQIVTHQFSKISPSTCATFTPILDVVGQIVQSSLWIHIWPFANTLHHFLTCCPPTTAAYTLSSDSEFWKGKHILPIKPESHYEFLCRTKFQTSLPSCQLISWLLHNILHTAPTTHTRVIPYKK